MSKYNIDDEIIIGVTNNKGVDKRKSTPTKKTQRKIKNKKVGNIIKCTSIIVLLIILLVFLMVSPIFNITDIIIEGNEILSNEKIISLSEVSLGKNIFRISKSSLKSKITSNAYVDSIEVKRELPSVLRIIVKERKVRYMIEYADGYVYLNNQGYIIDISKERKEVPIIVGYETENTEFSLGNRLVLEDLEKLQIVNKIIEATNMNEITNLITKIDISNSNNYTLTVESQGKVIYLGDCSDITTRISRVKAILEKTEGEEGEIFMDGNPTSELPRFRAKIF